jgi:hypothetical protein
MIPDENSVLPMLPPEHVPPSRDMPRLGVEIKFGISYCRRCGRLIAKDSDPSWVQPKPCQIVKVELRKNERAITYEIIGLADAQERQLPGPIDGLEDNWNSGIWRCEDGVPVEYIGDDVCEPEDSILRRDWAWVATALLDAYKLGRRESILNV